MFKHEIGKPKKCGYALPPIAHTYGKSPRKDPENARDGKQLQKVPVEWVNFSAISKLLWTGSLTRNPKKNLQLAILWNSIRAA